MFDSHLLLNCHLIEFLTTLQNFNKLMQYNCVTITKLIPNDVPILLQQAQIAYPELWLEHDSECAIQRHIPIQLCIIYLFIICIYFFAKHSLQHCLAAVLCKPAPWCTNMVNTLPED